jgi:hypothetical protein
MALGVFHSAAFSTLSGLAVSPLAVIAVRRESDSALATIYSDRAGTTPISQPGFVADSEGRFVFYAAGLAEGYMVTVSDAGSPGGSHTLRNVPIGTAQERDASDYGATLMDAATASAARDLLGASAGVFPITVGGTGQATAAAAFGALKQDATTSATGVVELATQAEVDAGTAGKVPTTDLKRITLGTPVATTSGTSVALASGLPTGLRRIEIPINGMSLSGTAHLLVQLGDSGGLETSGYDSSSVIHSGSASHSANVGSTAGLVVQIGSAAALLYGVMSLVLLNESTNLWMMTFTGHYGSGNNVTASGTKALSATLDRITLTTTNGTDTFDAGSANYQVQR